ncbi:MAG: AraC family transcriptional regulator [Gammaproteobacteria bacterium]|nr:MAG: AraC family transcriptional regulator [Gammaproteobacteria bacterium]
MKPVFETVEMDANSSIRVLHFQCGAFQQDHGWHYHPEYELSFVAKGEGTRFVGDSIESYQPGDLVLLGPNTPHCWVSNDPAAKPAREGSLSSEMIVIQFLPNCLGESFAHIPESKALRTLLDASARGIHYAGEETTTIPALMQETCQAHGLHRISLFIEILHILSTSKNKRYLSSENHVIDNDCSHGKRMEMIVEHISDNLSNEIKQTDMAELVGITPQSFSRFFKSASGRTFVSFVNAMRISKACQLLANTDEDILGISLACGYPNLSNFNRRFSELKHMTPGAYRKKHRSLPKSPSHE